VSGKSAKRTFRMLIFNDSIFFKYGCDDLKLQRIRMVTLQAAKSCLSRVESSATPTYADVSTRGLRTALETAAYL
jgi:hypothetical protein